MKRFTALMLMVLLLSCSGAKSLSDAERAKLDPALQRLLTGDRVAESDYDTGMRPDGTREYAVIIRSKNPDEVKSAGIRLSSAFGDVLVARVTSDELAKLVRLPSVRYVEAGSKNTLH